MSDIGVEARYTAGDYLEHNPGWHVEDSAWKAEQVLALLKHHNLRPGTVCEVGCGAGEILRHLSHSFPEARLTGYDVSPQAYALARTRESERLRFVLGDATQDEGLQCDLMLLMDVVEHVEDAFGFLRSLRGKARHTVVHLPLDLSVSAVLRARPLERTWESVGHLHFFTKELALRTMKAAGYEVVDWRYTPGAVQLPARSLGTRLAKAPRVLLHALSPDLAVRLLGGYSLLVLARSA